MTSPGQSPDDLPAPAASIPGSASADTEFVPTEEQAGAPAPLRFLVADDHPVNQFLVRELIEMRGHEAIVVGDGQDAVERWGRDRFDVVLMDIQMPRMNGIDASVRIRDLERERALTRRTPIIALTANSSPGDRSACESAGIDGFLSKPLDGDALFPLIEKLIHCGATRPRSLGNPHAAHAAAWSERAGHASPASVDAGHTGLIDKEAALRMAKGNMKVLAKLAELFRKQTPAIVEGIAAAISRRSSSELSFHAHRLKGSLSFLAVPSLESAALTLEHKGREGVWDDVPETWTRLRDGLEALDRELAALATPCT